MDDPDTSIGMEPETAIDDPDGQMNTSTQNLSNFLAFTASQQNKGCRVSSPNLSELCRFKALPQRNFSEILMPY